VLAGVGVGVAVKLRGDAGRGAPALIATSLVAGVASGALLGLLAVAASGAIGPGRLAEVGPDALQVAWRSAAEAGVGVLLGGAVVRRRAAGSADGTAEETPR